MISEFRDTSFRWFQRPEPLRNHHRIDRELLLRPEDAELAEPLVEEVLRKDADAGLLQIDFAVYGWNKMMTAVRGVSASCRRICIPIAPSFKDRNDGCFFAWYTAAVTGNGDIRPCCLLLNPDVPPLGNIHEKSMSEHWRGPAFQKMRDEMREILLRRRQDRPTTRSASRS